MLVVVKMAECLFHGETETVVGEGFVEIVDSVEVETVESIVEVGRGEYEAGFRGHRGRDLKAVDAFHLHIKECQVEISFLDCRKPFLRIGIDREADVAETFAEFRYNLQCKRFVVDRYTSEFFPVHESRILRLTMNFPSRSSVSSSHASGKRLVSRPRQFSSPTGASLRSSSTRLTMSFSV